MFISDLYLKFSFFVISLSFFQYQDDGGVIECTQKCSFLCNFLEEFRIGINSSVKV